MLWNGNICGKPRLMRISRQPPPVQMTDQKQLDNVKYFNYLGSMITNDARCTHEIKSRIVMAKAAFTKETFHQQFGLKFKEETKEMQHLEHSIAQC